MPRPRIHRELEQVKAQPLEREQQGELGAEKDPNILNCLTDVWNASILNLGPETTKKFGLDRRFPADAPLQTIGHKEFLKLLW